MTARRTGAVLLLLPLFVVELAIAAVAIRSGRFTDFHAYRSSARTLAAGRDPYAVESPRYLYPPLLAAALVPTLRVPERVAIWGFAALSAALLTWSAARLSRGSALVPLLALLFAPFALTQWNLQVNAFVLALLVVARDELDALHEARGGLVLGLAVALKPVALLFGLWLLAAGRVRALVSAAAVVAASFLLVVPFLGWHGVRPAARASAAALRPSWVETYPPNVSLNATIDRLSPERASALRHAAVSALVLGPALLLALAARRAAASSVLDLLLAATLLGAHLAWLHHVTFLFPAVADRRPRLAWGLAALLGVAAGWKLAGRLVPHGAALASASGTLALGLLAVSCAARVRRERS